MFCFLPTDQSHHAICSGWQILLAPDEAHAGNIFYKFSSFPTGVFPCPTDFILYEDQFKY